MSGVLFVVTIPTEPEEHSLYQRGSKSSLKSDNANQESEKYENGAFKIVRFFFCLSLSIIRDTLCLIL